MPGYSTRNLLLHVGGQPWQLRVLSETRQYAHPDGHGERLGSSIRRHVLHYPRAVLPA